MLQRSRSAEKERKIRDSGGGKEDDEEEETKPKDQEVLWMRLHWTLHHKLPHSDLLVS